MPRSKRCRFIQSYPDYWSFRVEEGEEEVIFLTLDEYEVIRLLDYQGMTQAECALHMGVARTTVTAMYEKARHKLAQMLVEGKGLRISGGDYVIRNNNFQIIAKGEHDMRIAVTYENGQIFQHFGHTAQFKIYDVENGKVTASQVIDTQGSGHGALAGFLKNAEVDTLICGGIGGGAQMALSEAGIKLYGGVTGPADLAVEGLLNNRLAYNPNVKCDHHDHEHEEGHTCGDHGCGSHSCGH
ncbi:Predicted DNA-binding protein, UPF0251 family [Lachnospiraceae bacterium XBB1006]|nr:Predicted DNA-binding protein, UPF0251 family [Lachnospiraceae bacterium XBB1006]